nr:MAG TPA: hypothetical protein [Caudoviricetes sp.]
MPPYNLHFPKKVQRLVPPIVLHPYLHINRGED